MGTLARASGFDLGQSMATTGFVWALPGQIVLVEQVASGAGILSVIAAVALTNARLLPMTVTLLPTLSDNRWPRRFYFLAAHFIAVTAWTVSMQSQGVMPQRERLPYFLGLGLTLFAITLTATFAGYFLVGLVPRSVGLGLVFLNPIYFMLMFVAEFRMPLRALALIFGAIAGPLFQFLGPDWGLLAAGLLAGTAALFADEFRRRRLGLDRA